MLTSTPSASPTASPTPAAADIPTPAADLKNLRQICARISTIAMRYPEYAETLLDAAARVGGVIDQLEKRVQQL